jgi:aminopeptidase N
VKIPIAAVLTTFIALTSPSSVWAQGTPDAASAPGAEHPDAIVRMHQKVAAANREYNREVAAAKKVFDQKKAVAAKKRDAAIEAAHQGVSG